MNAEITTLPLELLQQVPLFLLQAHTETSGGIWDKLVHSNLLNLLLVVVVLGWVIRKQNLLSGIETQRSRITSELRTIEHRKQEALDQLQEIQQRTGRLQSEVDGILRNARESAEALSAQMLADARTEAGKIVENAKSRVNLEQRAAMKDLQARLLSEAVADAREEMTRSLSVSDQKRSVEAFLDELPSMKGGR
jgi:F-type H+-transporting ATPase subunit b